MAKQKDRREADVSVTIRMRRDVRDLIESAISAQGKSLSAFMVESAHDRASELLLDQTQFHFAGPEAEEFACMLQTPLPPTDQLKSLFRGARPWGN